MSLAQLGCNPEQVDDEAQFALGTEGQKGSKVFTYLQANGAVAKGAACAVSGEGQARPANTNIADASFPLRVAQVAIGDDKFGWFQKEGAGQVLVAANCIAEKQLSTTAASGVLDDADTAGRISGLQLTANGPGQQGLADCWMIDPRIDIIQ